MASSTQIERAAAEWLARREAGWSNAEQAQFEIWLDASIAHRVAWIRLETGWQRASRLKVLGAGLSQGQAPPPGTWSELYADAAPGSVSSPVDLRGVVFQQRAQPRQPWAPRWFAVVAVLLVVVGVAGWWQFGGTERTSYVTAVGEMQTVTLDDGSVMQLSSGSRVEVVYSRRQRQLQLQRGEAYFEVARQLGRPFAVEAEGRRVVAVGTRFSVRRDSDDLRVAVTEGTVRLEDEARPAAAPTLLSAGTLAIASRDGVRVRPRSVNELEALLSWRQGLLVFRSTPLAEAVAEFNRYNTHKLVLDDPAITAIPVGGSFRWANTEAFVRVLEQGFELRAERRGDETHLRAQ
jgi:transmembrane sensor